MSEIAKAGKLAALLVLLYTPGSGIFFVINVERAVGLRDYESGS
jgi:hypothetical protein